MLSDLLSRIGGGLRLAPPVSPLLSMDGTTTRKPNPCIFCNVSAENGFKITYEDESFVAFEDLKPAGTVHYLLIPKKHIPSVRTLSAEDVKLVKTMERIGHTVLDSFGVPSDSRRMGFHIPPFNSINHLHLHIQSLPYNSYRRVISYFVSSAFGSYSKGFSWFVEVNQVTQILERGRRVAVAPS